MNHYPFHVGDYWRDCYGLSLLEHGVYRVLMDRYMVDEAPLPADLDKLCRKIGARTPEEREAVRAVSQEFFQERDGALHHKRCDEELARYRVLCEKNAGNGKKGGRPVGSHKKPYVPRETLTTGNPQETQSVTSGNPVATEPAASGNPIENPELTQKKPNQEPIAKNQEKAFPPAAGADAPDPIFGFGLQLLMRKRVGEKAARSFLGLMRKTVGDLVATELLNKVEQEDISEPVSWLTKAMAVRQKSRPQEPRMFGSELM